MSIEIQKPELERRVREGIQSGRFQDVDDLLTKAIDALSESSGGRVGALEWSQCPAVESVPKKIERRMGIPQHTYAGRGSIREPRGRRDD